MGGKPVIEYSANSVALAKCPSCSSSLDPFVEYQFTVVAMHLLLHRSRAYRHVILNRSTSFNKWFRFGLVCLLIESLCLVWNGNAEVGGVRDGLWLVLGTFGRFGRFVVGFGLAVVACNRKGGDWTSIAKASVVSQFPSLLLILAVAWGYPPQDFYWVISLYLFTVSVASARALVQTNAQAWLVAATAHGLGALG